MCNKLVSCIIPSYKRADMLKRAINSVLAQTYKNIEILVVDDNIPGDEYSLQLKEILKEFGKHVTLVTQEKHINGAVARNVGVKFSHGEYIAFLDDDDEWLPNKIERQVRVLEANSHIDGVAGGATEWKDGKEISTLNTSSISEDNLQLKVLLRKVRFATTTFICRKSAYDEIGGFNEKLIRSQDLQLVADFLTCHRIFPLTNERTVRIHVESGINRLDSKKLALNKEAYFKAMDTVMHRYSNSTQRRIKSAHYYEVALVAIREKKYFFALKYILKGLKSFRSILDLYIRCVERRKRYALN